MRLCCVSHWTYHMYVQCTKQTFLPKSGRLRITFPSSLKISWKYSLKIFLLNLKFSMSMRLCYDQNLRIIFVLSISCSPSNYVSICLYTVFLSEHISWAPAVQLALGKALSLNREEEREQVSPSWSLPSIEGTGVPQIIIDTNNEL